jgi:hypothetical protein
MSRLLRLDTVLLADPPLSRSLPSSPAFAPSARASSSPSLDISSINTTLDSFDPQHQLEQCTGAFPPPPIFHLHPYFVPTPSFGSLASGSDWQAYLGDKTGQRTVPSVFIDQQFIGGELTFLALPSVAA